jgi:DNA gyrase subunit A
MNKLYKLTPLQDNFSCNFNVLIGNVPKQLGIIGILKEWIQFRITCVKRELSFDLQKKKDRLHLLQGLGKILLDIDKAISIIRQTPNERDVIPNLMKGFQIDEIQAEFVAEIKLRNLNREYILKRTDEISALVDEIADIEDLIASESRLKTYIARQLKDIKSKYGKPRMTQLIYEEDIKEYIEEDNDEIYPLRLYFTKEGYFKKINPQNLRNTDEHKLKENDEILVEVDSDSSAELFFFSDQAQCYRSDVDAFELSKISGSGDYVPAKLGFSKGEKAIYMKAFSKGDPRLGNFIFIFENGKGVRIPASSYDTKSNRKKLTGAYNDNSPIVAIFYEEKPFDILLISDSRRAILIDSSLIPIKSTRTSQGVFLFNLKEGQKIIRVLSGYSPVGGKSYRKIKIPASGVSFETMDLKDNQVQLL